MIDAEELQEEMHEHGEHMDELLRRVMEHGRDIKQLQRELDKLE